MGLKAEGHTFMLLSRTVCFGLTLAGFCAFSAATARPASAQNLTYTLSGVTFSDGAVASGYFIFNPATQSFGSFDITTTNGTTDSQLGGVYVPPATGTIKSGIGGVASGNGYFEFDNFRASRTLGLATSVEASSPGDVPLAVAPVGFVSSQEYAGNSTRTITAGFLDITAPAAVPEASTTISLGLLLLLGTGSLVAVKRRRSVTAPPSV